MIHGSGNPWKHSFNELSLHLVIDSQFIMNWVRDQSGMVSRKFSIFLSICPWLKKYWLVCESARKWMKLKFSLPLASVLSWPCTKPAFVILCSFLLKECPKCLSFRFHKSGFTLVWVSYAIFLYKGYFFFNCKNKWLKCGWFLTWFLHVIKRDGKRRKPRTLVSLKIAFIYLLTIILSCFKLTVHHWVNSWGLMCSVLGIWF